MFVTITSQINLIILFKIISLFLQKIYNYCRYLKNARVLWNFSQTKISKLHGRLHAIQIKIYQCSLVFQIKESQLCTQLTIFYMWTKIRLYRLKRHRSLSHEIWKKFNVWILFGNDFEGIMKLLNWHCASIIVARNFRADL